MASPFANDSSEELDHQRNGNYPSHPIFNGFHDAKARRQDADDHLNHSNGSQEESPDGGEKGGDDEKGSPKPVGFWDSRLTTTRNSVFLLWLRTSKPAPSYHMNTHGLLAS